MKLTSKQEKFAELVASGEGQSEAYRKAYDAQAMNDNVISVEASRLMENPKITLRINELREPVITKTHKALENILAELDELKKAAMAKEQYSTAVNAVMGQAKLLGYNVNKPQTNEPVTINIVRFSEEKQVIQKNKLNIT